jgi:hypothetical protein
VCHESIDGRDDELFALLWSEPNWKDEHDRIRISILEGSSNSNLAIGRSIERHCHVISANISPPVLENGGKSPIF